MAEIIFTYKGKETNIQCNKDEKIKEVCRKYATKIQIDINKILFIYNDYKINENLTFNEHANKEDQKRNKMNILVYEKYPSQIDIPSFELIGRGINFGEKEFYVITNSSAEALNARDDPLSNGIIERIRKNIGGKWFVFANVKGLKGHDFAVSEASAGYSLSFNIQNFSFNVCYLPQFPHGTQDNIFPQYGQDRYPSQIDIPSFELSYRGKNFSEKEFYVITNASAEALNARDDPLSNGVIERIRKNIGGKWLVFACVKGLKGYDYFVSDFNVDNLLSFYIQNFLFQVTKY